MKILTYLLVVLGLIGLIYIFSLFQEFSYFSLSKNYVEMGTLLLRPMDYSTGNICTVGKYKQGEGVSELVDAENPTEVIWIVGPVEQSIFSSLWQKYISRDAYKTAFARVCGIFEVSQKNHGFGTNGAYRYQITTNR